MAGSLLAGEVDLVRPPLKNVCVLLFWGTVSIVQVGLQLGILLPQPGGVASTSHHVLLKSYFNNGFNEGRMDLNLEIF